MRKLATIQRVLDLQSIPGADAIEVASVLGWRCVVKKGEVKVGDNAVYIEIDSICPPKEPFKFLEERKYRVRTIKLRGQISQGLLMPLCYFPQLKNVTEGQDVTETLAITKYDPEAAAEAKHAKQIKHNPVRAFFMQFFWFRRLHRLFFPNASRGWPEFIHKTDEERIQNIPHVLLEYVEDAWYATEKLDGQSASYWVTRTKGLFGKTVTTFGVCSRNIYLKTKHRCSWWDVAVKYGIQERLEVVGKNICIQGEIVGPEIQGNKYGLKDYEFYVFNVFDIDTQCYYSFEETVEFCNLHGFKMVPIVNQWVNPPTSVQDVIKQATAKSFLNLSVLREGVVWRTIKNKMNGMPISFKAVSAEFLLKHGE